MPEPEDLPQEKRETLLQQIMRRRLKRGDLDDMRLRVNIDPDNPALSSTEVLEAPKPPPKDMGTPDITTGEGSFVNLRTGEVGLTEKENVDLSLGIAQSGTETESDRRDILKAEHDVFKGLSPGVKQALLDEFLVVQKGRSDIERGEFASAGVLGINFVQNLGDFASGIHQLGTAAAVDLYGVFSGNDYRERLYEERQAMQEKPLDDPDEEHQKIVDLGVARGDIKFDAEGNPYIVRKGGGGKTSIIKQGLLEAFRPHMESYKAWQAGDHIEAYNIMVEHYNENPLDLMFDASMALAVGGAGLKGAGTFAKFLARTGTNITRKSSLAVGGEILLASSDYLDPLMLIARTGGVTGRLTGKAVRAGLGKTDLGVKLLAYMDRTSAKFVNEIWHTATRETNIRLSKDAERIRDIFKGLPDEEKQAFIAIIEGRASPLAPREEFVEALQAYRQWINVETEFLIGEKLLDSQTARMVAYQPLVAASSHQLNDVISVVEDVGRLKDQLTDTLKAVETEVAKATPGPRPAIHQAYNEGKLPEPPPPPSDSGPMRTGDDVINDIKKSLGQESDLPTIEKKFDDEMARSPVNDSGVQVADDVAATPEDVARLGEIDPEAAARLNDLQKDIGALTDYADRLRKNTPGPRPQIAPRAALIAEAKALKPEIDRIADEAAASVRPATRTGDLLFPGEQRTLTFHEIGERSGIPAQTLGDARNTLVEAGFEKSDARSMVEIAVKHQDINASSVSEFIDSAAERKARELYPDFDTLDPETQNMAIQGFVFEAREIIKDLRAPIEAGKRARPTREATIALVDKLFNFMKVADDLDRVSGRKLIKGHGPVWDRGRAYLHKILDDRKLSRNLLTKAETKLKKFRKSERAVSITGLAQREKDTRIQAVEAILLNRRLEAQRIREMLESRADAFRSTYGADQYVDAGSDGIILMNLEKEINDMMNVHEPVAGALDPAYTHGGTDITLAQREEMLMNVALYNSTTGLARRRSIRLLQQHIGVAQDQINVLVRRQSAYRLPPELLAEDGITIELKKFKEFIKKARTELEATGASKGHIDAEIAELSRRRSEFNTAGNEIRAISKSAERSHKRIQKLKGGSRPLPSELAGEGLGPETAAGTSHVDNLTPEAAELKRGRQLDTMRQRRIRLRDQIDELNRDLQALSTSRDSPAARQLIVRRIDLFDDMVKRLERRIDDLEHKPVKTPKPDPESPSTPRKGSTAVDDIADSPEPKRTVPDDAPPSKPISQEPLTRVPKIAQGALGGKVEAQPRATLGALSRLVREDSKIVDAFKRVRDYVHSRGMPGVLRPDGTFDTARITSYMTDMKVPRPTRMKSQQILKAFNDVRPKVQGEIEPFLVQIMLDSKPLSNADMVQVITGKSLEGKFTKPTYFPHQFEDTRNVFDAPTHPDTYKEITRIARSNFDEIEKKTPGTTTYDEQLIMEMQRRNITGYFDPDEKFHPITKGRGARMYISGVIGNRIKPVITRPGFLKRRTGAWGYNDHDPERVLAIHRTELQRFLRNRNIVKRLKDSKFVRAWDGTKAGLLPGHVPANFEGMLKFYEATIDFRKGFAEAVDKTKYAGDEVMRDAIYEFLPKLRKVLAVGANPAEYRQIPVAMAQSIKLNMVADLPPAWVRLMVDKPTNFWRGMTLAWSPRWYLNNIVGNTYQAMLSGVGSAKYILAKQKMFADLLPDEFATTGLLVTEAREKGMRFGSVKIMDRFYAFNNRIERRFKNAVYMNQAVKAARKAKVKSAGYKLFRSELEMQDILTKVKADPTTRQRLIDVTHEFMFDYSNLSPMERLFIRRVIPFWTWYKNIAKFSYMLPLKHPKRAWVLGKLGMIGHEAVVQQFDEIGIEFDDLPEYMQGRVILNYKSEVDPENPDDPQITYLNNQGQNPFHDVLNFPGAAVGFLTNRPAPAGESRLPGLHPALTVGIEQDTKVNRLTGKKFTDPNLYQTFDGGMRYVDPETGEDFQTTGVAPPILEHILRQTPQWKLIKEMAWYIAGHKKFGMQYGTNTVFDPKWYIDPLTGLPKYPREVMASAMSLIGFNLAWTQRLNDFQVKHNLTDSSITGGRFNREYDSNEKFRNFVSGRIDELETRDFTEEQYREIFEKMMKPTKKRF